MQGASGGMATGLIQMGRAAGFKVWATSRNDAGRKMALKLGAEAVLATGEELLDGVDAVVDNIGAAIWHIFTPPLTTSAEPSWTCWKT